MSKVPQGLEIRDQLKQALLDLHKHREITDADILIIGTSTSEILGEHIGTAGTEEIAKILFETFKDFQLKTNVQLAFQCCEHLNRAIVVCKKTAKSFNLEVVSVVPVVKAGGSMAAYAYKHLEDPVVVEFIKADVGIDIGDTLIGMHLKHVAVPVRSKIKKIGSAHISLAVTRPKLIGGNRAVYVMDVETESCK